MLDIGFFTLQIRHLNLRMRYLNLQIRHLNLRIRHLNLRIRYLNLRLRHLNLRIRHLNLRIRHLDLRMRHLKLQTGPLESSIFKIWPFSGLRILQRKTTPLSSFTAPAELPNRLHNSVTRSPQRYPRPITYTLIEPHMSSQIFVRGGWGVGYGFVGVF